MYRFVMAMVCVLLFSVSVPAGEELLSVSSSTKTRLGKKLPDGQLRLIFSTMMDEKIWRPLIRQGLKEAKQKILLWDERAEQFINAGDSLVITIDDIIIKVSPPKKK